MQTTRLSTAIGKYVGLAHTAPERGWRRLRHAVERRRQERIRADPRVPKAVLKTARKILILCHGNIIRSPFAAFLIRRAVGDRPTISVASAGLAATPGHAPDPNAVLVAAGHRVDLRGHAASLVDPCVVAHSDVIFVMDIPQLLVMRKRFPRARAKTFLLTCLTRDGALEVSDPFGRDESVFQASYALILQAVGPIVDALGQPWQTTDLPSERTVACR